jgi:hypothetical protein
MYEELYDLYSSLNIVRTIKSRRMRWAGHAACLESSGMHMGDVETEWKE